MISRREIGSRAPTLLDRSGSFILSPAFFKTLIGDADRLPGVMFKYDSKIFNPRVCTQSNPFSLSRKWMGFMNLVVFYQHIKVKKLMNLTIQTTFITANETYFAALKQLDKIVETPEFIEYVHPEKQIYVRHDKRIQEGDGCAVHIEPQTNITRTVKFGAFAFKLQLSVIKHKMKYEQMNGVSVHVITNPMTKADFITGLNVCEGWRLKLQEFVDNCEVAAQE